MSKSIALVLGAVAALILASCSIQPGPTAAEFKPRASPLERYFSKVGGTDVSVERQKARALAQQKKTEALVASCMNTQGFDYIPFIQPASYPAKTDYRPESRDWVQRWGYGAVDSPKSDSDSATPETDDPNTRYVESLSDTAKEAYKQALNGDIPTAEESSDGAAEVTDWRDRGCYGRAIHELGDDPTAAPQFAPTYAAIDAFQSKLEDQSDFSTINKSWSSCMTDRGHPGFTRQLDARLSIFDAAAKLPEDQSDPSTPAARQLHHDEVALALDDLACRQKTDYAAEHQRIQAELETRFMNDHKAELDALLAAAELSHGGS